MPRRPDADVAATEVLVIRVSPATAAALKAIARVNLTSRAAFIRDAIDAAIAECGERRQFTSRRAPSASRPAA